MFLQTFEGRLQDPYSTVASATCLHARSSSRLAAEGYGIGLEGSTRSGATTFTIKKKWQPRVAISVGDGGDLADVPADFSDPRGVWLDVPVTGTISGWEIACDIAGSAEITISRCLRADYPTFTDLFTATISSDVIATDTGLSYDIFEHDVMRAILNGLADFTSLQMHMTVDRRKQRLGSTPSLRRW